MGSIIFSLLSITFPSRPPVRLAPSPVRPGKHQTHTASLIASSATKASPSSPIAWSISHSNGTPSPPPKKKPTAVPSAHHWRPATNNPPPPRQECKCRSSQQDGLVLPGVVYLCVSDHLISVVMRINHVGTGDSPDCEGDRRGPGSVSEIAGFPHIITVFYTAQTFRKPPALSRLSALTPFFS